INNDGGLINFEEAGEIIKYYLYGNCGKKNFVYIMKSDGIINEAEKTNKKKSYNTYRIEHPVFTGKAIPATDQEVPGKFHMGGLSEGT
ncbi:MAG: hypothetical protein JWN76_3281, partial [Chitinophagaceae bacterium]|nr:hypothetical protein [Chitinophagaceae bacterium]